MENTCLDYLVMTYAELNQKDPKLVQQELDLYCKGNSNDGKVHFCGLAITGDCDYVSVVTIAMHHHIKRVHSIHGANSNLQNNSLLLGLSEWSGA